MTKQPLNSQDVIGLLSKLKESTPDYPADLFAARKAAFMQQVVTINFDGSGLSGKGGGDGGLGASGGTGGSGALGGLTTAQTVMLQVVIGVWVVAAMLTAAYVFRDQIIDLLQDNGIVEITQEPVIEPTAPATLAPIATQTETPTIELIPQVTAEPGDLPGVEATPDSGKDDPGLHLGQTPGTPDTPNQNKPDKPNTQDKSDKPEKTK